MQSRTMIWIIAVPTILLLMAAPGLSAAESDISEMSPDEEHLKNLEVLSTLVRLDDLAGKVRITGKKVEESPITAESFQQWSELVWERREGRQFRWKYGESRDTTEQSDVIIQIAVLGSPRAAADAMVSYLRNSFRLLFPGERITEGGLFVGDFAFPKSRPINVGSPERPLLERQPPTGLAFVRNNVAVIVVAQNRELLEELVAFVDGKLVEALAPTDDPAFSNKPGEPPAEGDAERSLAARRTAVNARDEQWWAKVRKRVDFDDWAGKVQITGKRVWKCPVDAASFRKWSGSVEERHLAKDSYFGWGADAEKHSISMRVCASPHEAADRLMYKLFTADWTRPGERITEGVLAVGDVAFPMINLNPSVQNNRLAFVRNNVAVVVTAPSRELLEELVAFVDGKLVEALVPTDDPAFSNKLEDPPSEGEAESESENEEQAEK